MMPTPSLYNQGILCDDDFIANFVARQSVLASILRRLQASESGRDRLDHVLIGARGMGKTSLLRRVAIAIGRAANLSERYVPLNFREEQYNVLTLGDFWRNCGEALAEWAEQSGRLDLAQRLDAALSSASWAGNEAPAESFKLEIHQLNRRAILLVDNIDLILDNLSSADKWVLRRALQEDNGPVLIGAATQPLQESANRSAAFYEFFQPIYLEPLNEQETEDCMRAYASHRAEYGEHVVQVLDSQPERLKTLHALTGGNPRVLTLIYKLLETAESDAAMADLEILLDQVTPYYKSRVEEYQTPHQRAVIDAIALNWDPITTRALSRVTSIPTTTLSPLLIKLRKDGLIESVQSSGSYAAHQIVERFFNIWYLMRHGTRRTKQKMRWLVAFLTSFFSSNELSEIARRANANGLTKNWHVDYASAFEEALACNGRDIARRERYGHTEPSAQTAARLKQRQADRIGRLKTKQNPSVYSLGTEAYALWKTEHYSECLIKLEELISKLKRSSRPEFRRIYVEAMFNKAITLGRLGDNEGELAAYDVILGQYGPLVDLQDQVAATLVNKGAALGRRGDASGEMSAYREVVSRFADAKDLAVLEQVANALINLGLSYEASDDDAAALAAYNDAISRLTHLDGDADRERLARAMASRAVLLGKMGRQEASIAACDDVVSRFGSDDRVAIRGYLGSVIFHKAMMLDELGDHVREIETYDDLISRFQGDPEPALQMRAAKAHLNKGITLGQLGDLRAAIQQYDAVVRLFARSPALPGKEVVASALMSKGLAFDRIDDHKSEIAAYDQLIGMFGSSDAPSLRVEVARAMINKAGALDTIQDNEGALAICDSVVSFIGNDKAPAMLEQVAKALINKGVSLGKLGKRHDELAAYDELLDRFGKSEQPNIGEHVAFAMLYRGITLSILNRPQDELDAYGLLVDRFLNSGNASVQMAVAQALFHKAVTLGKQGNAEVEMATYADIIERYAGHGQSLIGDRLASTHVPGRRSGREDDPAVSAGGYEGLPGTNISTGSEEIVRLVANVRIRLANLVLDRSGDTELAEKLFREAKEIEPLCAEAYLAWVYLLSDRAQEADRAIETLDGLPRPGWFLIKAAVEISRENFGSAVEYIAKALQEDLTALPIDFSDDIERLFKLAHRKGYGDRLLEWLEGSGFSDRYAPVYAAFMAYVRSEDTLADVNPEVRQAAQIIYSRLRSGAAFQGS